MSGQTQAVSSSTSSPAQPPSFAFPLGQSIIEAEQRSQNAFARAFQSIAAVQRSSSAAREADDARIIELEKSCALEKARADAAETTAKEKVEAADARVKALIGLVETMQKRLTALESNEATIKQTLITFINTYNGHHHTVPWARQNATGGVSSGVSLPKFDENKKAS